MVLVSLIHWMLLGYLALLTIRAVLDWVPMFVRDWEPRGGLRVLAEFVLTLTDPPIRALRPVLPPVRAGQVQFDLAFTIVFLAVLFALRWF